MEAFLTGLPSRCWGNMVYYLPIPCGFKSLDIVHLEMANILVVVKIFARTWTGRWVLIKCDNQTVVALFIYLGFYVAFNTVQVISEVGGESVTTLPPWPL